ncbi:MAG: DNA primase [Crocinitomicaceae bacterium]|nr:DNA primase [Crocinitomicaceae bacterium]
MARIPPHIIEDIMNTARIEEVIGDFVALKRSGSNLKGLSPFTDEKSPSFMVSPAKQIFKCFSSGKGGTVVSFIMEHEHFSYPEALKWLANRYNIEIPEERPLTPEEQEQITERESLQIINEYARDFFVDRMHKGEEGKAIGLSYFIERGFRPEIIERFQLGYCPQNEGSLTDAALKKGYKLKYLEALGLSRTKDDRHFDFFSGRVMFPIHSISGNVLGFGGRTLQSGKKVAKYFNSPESIIYNKSKILYGLYFAKSSIIKYDNSYLVEGYTDVISMHQAGVENVVASSGTALTKDQIKLMKRYSNNITILYDGDAAGIRASFRGIDLILEEGMNVKVVLFPEGEDPDSFSKRHGSDEVKRYIEENQRDFVGFKTDILLKDSDNDPIKRAGLIKDIVESIALIPDDITRSVYLKETSEQFELDEQTLLNEMNKIRRNKRSIRVSQHLNVSPEQQREDLSSFQMPQQPAKQSVTIDPNEGDKAKELDLIRILVLYGSRAIELNQAPIGEPPMTVDVSLAELVVHEIDRDDLVFSNPVFQEIYEICKKGLEEDILYSPTYFLRNENQEIVQLVSDFLTNKYELSASWLKDFKIYTNDELQRLSQALHESLYTFKNSKIKQRIEYIRERLKPDHAEFDESKMESLLREQMQLQKIQSVFAKELNRIIV